MRAAGRQAVGQTGSMYVSRLSREKERMFTHRDRTLKDSGDELCREMNDTRRNDGVFNYAPWEADAGGISEKRVLATPVI